MADATATIEEPRVAKGKSGGIASPSFLGLVLTQTLTSINDNTFRWLAIGIGKDFVGEKNAALVLSAGTACFVLPYLVLAAPAGFLADRFSKRTVIVSCKIAEMAIMTLGVLSIVLGSPGLLFVTVALMGAQSALFSPAKSGSIPELVRAERISQANGLMALTGVIATVVGMAMGNLLSDWTGFKGQDRWWLSALVLLGIAVVGWLISLPIKAIAAANPTRKFPRHFLPQMARDIAKLSAHRPMLRVAFGIVFFWSLAAIVQLNIDQFTAEGGAEGQRHNVPLLLALIMGVGVGSVLAGFWSRGHVELGILPLGAGGIAISGMWLFTIQGDLIQSYTDVAKYTLYYWEAGTLLFLLGISAGLFNVPLESYMQHRSPRQSRGSILAASNLLTFSGVMLAALLYAVLRGTEIGGFRIGLWLSSQEIFLLCGVLTIPVFVYIGWLIPQASIRFLVWLGSCTIYRIRVRGRDNLPETGGALMVSNHLSWLDGALFLLTSSRPVRIIAWSGSFRNPVFKALARFWGVILIGGGPKSVQRALVTANRALRNDELVCIFPEGGITRSGMIQSFKPGLLRILKDTDVPVIPVYLDELWGSIFSFKGGRFFWKIPKKWRYPISIHFGKAVSSPEDLFAIRRAVQDLGASAVTERSERMPQIPRTFIRRCKQRKRGLKIADSLGTEMSGATLLLRTLILRRILRREVLATDEEYVGLLLPPSCGGVTANAALALDRRIAVNLNYTAKSEVLNQCLEMCGIKHILTSRKFMSKMNFDLDAELVYLDDFRDQVTTSDKLTAAMQAFAMPSWMLEAHLGLHKVDHDDVLTIIFTSGSTGTPKGVMLTYANIASNVEAIEQVVHLDKHDVLMGLLPLFHSFGYTITMWAVLAIDVKGVYHFSPLDGRQIGELSEKYGTTVLLSTPTFLRTYLRRCTPEQFKKLDVVVTGAEKLPKDLADAFEARFGVRPVEGYGTTELSPLATVNVPPSRSREKGQLDAKEGTVGRPVPGVSGKITDLDTGEDLGADQPGMLWISGPNVMKGYLHREDLTAEVIQDGWYKTGDVAKIDEDGFVTITGRISRFSKIGGEMVPHIQIEETLNGLIGIDDESGELKAAVTAVPHEKKGEQLIVLHTELEQSPEELCEGLAKAGLPNIFIPSPDSFYKVDSLPILGSGKLDLKAIQAQAAGLVGKDTNP